MSKKSNKCQHGWNGEGFDVRPGDSIEVVHQKNKYNAAIGSAFGGVPDQPTAGSFAAQSFMNAHTFKTAPAKIEAGCNCSDAPNKNSSQGVKSGPVTNFLASQTNKVVDEVVEATRKSAGNS